LTEHCNAVEQFAQLAGKWSSRIAVSGHGCSGSSASLFVRKAVQNCRHVTVIVDERSKPGGTQVLDIIAAASPEEVKHARKRRLFEHGSRFVALPGGVAVWEELMELWCGAQLGLHEYALGLLNIGGFFTPLLELVANTVRAGFTSPETLTLMVVAESPEDLLQRLEDYNPTRVVKMKPFTEEPSTPVSKM